MLIEGFWGERIVDCLGRWIRRSEGNEGLQVAMHVYESYFRGFTLMIEVSVSLQGGCLGL